MSLYCDKCGTTHDCTVCPNCRGFGNTRGDEMSAMTLEQVRDWLTACSRGESLSPMRGEMRQWADAIDAHLTAHAEMVEKVREVIEKLHILPVNRKVMGITDLDLARELAAAIGDAK